MKLTHCTFTGIDHATDIHRLVDISRRFSYVEWGILYSPDRQGAGRYPSSDFIAELLEALPEFVRVALHLCGRGVDQVLTGEGTAASLAKSVAQRQGRMQLNFNQSVRQFGADVLHKLFDRHPNLCIITQHNRANTNVVGMLRGQLRHCILFDASGGRGLQPEGWPEALQGQKCGYAGGLGPANIAIQLPAIATAAAGEPFWIDMEGKLRDDSDTLSLDACEKVAQQVREFSQHG